MTRTLKDISEELAAYHDAEVAQMDLLRAAIGMAPENPLDRDGHDISDIGKAAGLIKTMIARIDQLQQQRETDAALYMAHMEAATGTSNAELRMAIPSVPKNPMLAAILGTVAAQHGDQSQKEKWLRGRGWVFNGTSWRHPGMGVGLVAQIQAEKLQIAKDVEPFRFMLKASDEDQADALYNPQRR